MVKTLLLLLTLKFLAIMKTTNVLVNGLLLKVAQTSLLDVLVTLKARKTKLLMMDAMSKVLIVLLAVIGLTQKAK
jgi:hypothetical protein